MIKRCALLAALIVGTSLLVPAIRPGMGSPAPAIAVGRVHNSFIPGDGKIFVLIIGSDARSGNPNLRADAIHIAGINTKTMRGGILNFPRDSWLSIPGHGPAKVNEALHLGGPRLLAKTLENETGIRLDYYALVGFEGFMKIIKNIHGVGIDLPQPVQDSGSGANLKAGRQRLSPTEALAYARSRKAFSGGDVTRTTNQGRLLLAMLGEFRNKVGVRPQVLFDWIAATRRHVRFNISYEEMFRLAILTSQVNRSDVRNVTVPVSIGSVGAASVVFIRPGAESLYDRFRESASL
jgi:LCP family protein required for cell wall assembly